MPPRQNEQGHNDGRKGQRDAEHRAQKREHVEELQGELGKRPQRGGQAQGQEQDIVKEGEQEKPGQEHKGPPDVLPHTKANPEADHRGQDDRYGEGRLEPEERIKHDRDRGIEQQHLSSTPNSPQGPHG